MKRLLEQATRMIKINSVTANGNEEIANYVMDLLAGSGLKAKLQQVTHSLEHISKRQFNVIGILGDQLVDRKIRKGLLLNSHLDTVGPGRNDNWTENFGNPFNAVIKDGRIYGLGAVDVKLDFLCKLRAVEKFREKKLRMPVYLVGTAGEEQGMLGVKYLLQSGALNPKYVIVGEPSELKVVYAHKGLNIFKVSIGFQLIERDAHGFNRRISLHSFGRAAHGAYPALGLNSIAQIFGLLRLAADSGFDLRFTRLQGGETVNKVPDRAAAEFYLTSHQFEDFKRFFREASLSAGDEGAFRMDLGGLGETGVRFLPESLFACVSEVSEFFSKLTEEFKTVSDTSFNPPVSTVNFGQLLPRLGGIDLMFDIRLLPQVSPDELEQKIIQGMQAIAGCYTTLNLAVNRVQLNPSLAMTLDHEFVQICQKAMDLAGLQGGFQKKSTSTEAAQYFKAGYEAVVFGPGISHGNSHSPNEYNRLDHLEKAIIFYEKLIERTCL